MVRESEISWGREWGPCRRAKKAPSAAGDGRLALSKSFVMFFFIAGCSRFHAYPISSSESPPASSYHGQLYLRPHNTDVVLILVHTQRRKARHLYPPEPSTARPRAFDACTRLPYLPLGTVSNVFSEVYAAELKGRRSGGSA